jgi:hypothetical protein
MRLEVKLKDSEEEDPPIFAMITAATMELRLSKV